MWGRLPRHFLHSAANSELITMHMQLKQPPPPFTVRSSFFIFIFNLKFVRLLFHYFLSVFSSYIFFHSSRLDARLKRVWWISKFADRIENIKYIFQFVPRNLLSREVDNSTNIYLHCSSLNKRIHSAALGFTFDMHSLSHSWKGQSRKGRPKEKIVPFDSGAARMDNSIVGCIFWA